jgi:hypothetical protein
MKKLHTASEPGNPVVTVDRFLKVTSTCTPELFSKIFPSIISIYSSPPKESIIAKGRDFPVGDVE